MSNTPRRKTRVVTLKVEVEYEADGADILWGICPPDDKDVENEQLPEWMQKQIEEQIYEAENLE